MLFSLFVSLDSEDYFYQKYSNDIQIIDLSACFKFLVKCEGVAGASNDACIEAVLKEIVVEIGKPGYKGLR